MLFYLLAVFFVHGGKVRHGGVEAEGKRTRERGNEMEGGIVMNFRYNNRLSPLMVIGVPAKG